jgi:hypothetical protein
MIIIADTGPLIGLAKIKYLQYRVDWYFVDCKKEMYFKAKNQFNYG